MSVRYSRLAVLSFLCLPMRAYGHPEGFSGIHVTITREQVQAVITVHTRDLGKWFPPRKYPNYVADVIREMRQSVDDLIELQIDGQSLVVDDVNAYQPEVGLIEIDVSWSLPSSAEAVELLIWSKHLIRLPPGHQQLLFVEDRREIAADAPQRLMRLEDLLTVERDAGVLLLPPLQDDALHPFVPESTPLPREGSNSPVNPASTDLLEPRTRNPKVLPGSASAHSSSHISFFQFGVEHIITGYDHLLFLAALLLTCTQLKEGITIITCFTVAHSITLTLATLDVVRLPASIAEPAIALTIVFVAVENLLRRTTLWRRAAITCIFGLIHGLGFASALRDIGLGTVPGGVLWPLFKFNLGVEVGQLSVAAIFLPLLWIARRNRLLRKWLVPVGSILIALCGGYWLVTRVVSVLTTG